MTKVLYKSQDRKESFVTEHYNKTANSSHRYLAYRDVPALINKYIKGKQALDFGTGTGISANLLQKLGFDVHGADVSSEMLNQARETIHPSKLHLISNNKIPTEENSFDLVFSSFVLFEQSSRENILAYLSEARRVLKDDGIFIGITGSRQMHLRERDWLIFGTDYPEDQNPVSGDIVKAYHYETGIEFSDYYWQEEDYIPLIQASGLKCIEVLHPLGRVNELYKWQDELQFAPFVIFVATT